MKDIENPKDPLADLLRSLPTETSPHGLTGRIMERVAREKSPAARRAERSGFVWTIGLSVLMLGGGWGFYTMGVWPKWSGISLSAQAWAMLRTLAPAAAIVLGLLVGDLYLRRYFFMKMYRKSKTAG